MMFAREIAEFAFFGKVVSIVAISNLFLFFLFLRKDLENKAKGIMLASVVLLVLSMTVDYAINTGL